LYFSDANLPSPVGAASGEGGRPLYGTISAAGLATPARRVAALGQVVRASNRSGDLTTSVAVQLRQQFVARAGLSASYASTRAVASAPGPGTNAAPSGPRERAGIATEGNGPAAGLGTAAQQDSVYDVLARFIEGEPCLRQQRGRLLERNSCRNPWFGTLNARA